MVYCELLNIEPIAGPHNVRLSGPFGLASNKSSNEIQCDLSLFNEILRRVAP